MKARIGRNLRTGALFLSLWLAVPGCQYTVRELLESEESQVKIRSIQTRAFDTSDRIATLRTIIATLQDVGFIIDHADYTLGSVSATKFDFLYQPGFRMNVTVRPRGRKQLLVRANARLNLTRILEPGPYQSFFASLSKAMFLEAQQVN